MWLQALLLPCYRDVATLITTLSVQRSGAYLGTGQRSDLLFALPEK